MAVINTGYEILKTARWLFIGVLALYPAGPDADVARRADAVPVA